MASESAHGHRHSHGSLSRDEFRGTAARKLLISTIITLLFVVIELGGAWLANSLSLLGDAFHNFTDSLALVLALAALRIELLPATPSKSFGYQRAGILVAFVNAAALVGLTVYLLIEAWERFRQPEQVHAGWMIGTSAVALVMNVAISAWLHREGKQDLGVRSAVIHLMGDALSSVGIIIGAIAISLTGVMVIDPAISVVIAALILWSSWGVLREAVNILLEGVPEGIDAELVGRAIAAMPGVSGVHHLHIWALAPSRPSLSCHLMLGDVSLREADGVLERVNAMLNDRWRIVHTTIQVEYATCAADDPWCITHEVDASG